MPDVVAVVQEPATAVAVSVDRARARSLGAPRGSVQSLRKPGLTDLKLLLHPLQSSSFSLLGFTDLLGFTEERMTVPVDPALCAMAGLAAPMDRLAIARAGAATSTPIERLLNDQRLCTHPP